MAAGRKIFDGKNEESVIQKLEEIFIIGGTDGEACLFADISTSALYEYQKKYPEFLERKRKLKQQPNLTARQEVVKGLKDNPEFSLKYLERKVSKEFAPKNKLEHTGEDGGAIEIKDARQILASKLDNLASKTGKKKVNKRAKSG